MGPKKLAKNAKIDYLTRQVFIDGEELPFYIDDEVSIYSTDDIHELKITVLVKGDIEVVDD